MMLMTVVGFSFSHVLNFVCHTALKSSGSTVAISVSVIVAVITIATLTMIVLVIIFIVKKRYV